MGKAALTARRSHHAPLVSYPPQEPLARACVLDCLPYVSSLFLFINQSAYVCTCTLVRRPCGRPRRCRSPCEKRGCRPSQRGTRPDGRERGGKLDVGMLQWEGGCPSASKWREGGMPPLPPRASVVVVCVWLCLCQSGKLCVWGCPVACQLLPPSSGRASSSSSCHVSQTPGRGGGPVPHSSPVLPRVEWQSIAGFFSLVLVSSEKKKKVLLLVCCVCWFLGCCSLVGHAHASRLRNDAALRPQSWTVRWGQRTRDHQRAPPRAGGRRRSRRERPPGPRCC